MFSALKKIDGGKESLHLHFELGKFPHSVMCQYALESEARTALIEGTRGSPKLPIRDAVARTPEMILEFGVRNVARIGVNTLILLRETTAGIDRYVPLVYRRSALTMSQRGLFDCVSSCIF